MSLPPPLLLLVGGPPAEVEYGPPTPALDNHIRLEIALTDTAYTSSPTWTDFTSLVRSCSWSYGWDAPDGQVTPGELRITASNRDGRWDAATGLGGSPWAGNVRPWLGVRVSITNDGWTTARQMWRGFLADVTLSSGAFDATVELRCVNLMGVLSAIAIEDVERPEELSGDRITAILDAANIPSAFRATIDTGTVVLSATTLNGQALGLIQECVRTEGGLFWSGRTGLVTFQNRFYFAEVESTFTPLELDDTDIKAIMVPQRLSAFSRIERAAVQWASGEVVRAGATVSGWPDTARREMGTSAVWRADAAALAQWLYRVNALSGDQISGVSCDVLRVGNTSVLDQLVSLNRLMFLTRCDLTGLTPVHGHELSGEFWISGETHTVDRNGVWRMDLDLFPVANAWQTDSQDYYTFGASLSGKVAGR